MGQCPTSGGFRRNVPVGRLPHLPDKTRIWTANTSMKATIALFGASGAIGQSISSALREQNLNYRVVGRNAASLEKAFGSDSLAKIRTWDPDSLPSIGSAAEGIETLIYMVGVPYDQFNLHPRLMRQTIDGAVAAGVRRILLIGTLYPFGRPQQPRINEQHPREPHTYKGKMRKEQEDICHGCASCGSHRSHYSPTA